MVSSCLWLLFPRLRIQSFLSASRPNLFFRACVFFRDERLPRKLRFLSVRCTHIAAHSKLLVCKQTESFSFAPAYFSATSAYLENFVFLSVRCTHIAAHSKLLVCKQTESFLSRLRSSLMRSLYHVRRKGSARRAFTFQAVAFV